MSLKNEAHGKFRNTRVFYRQYTEGMTPKRINREFHADTTRLYELYKEAVGSRIDKETNKVVPVHVRLMRLFSALVRRLTPARRLVFLGSFAGFILYYFVGGTFAQLILPLSFLAIILILMLELLEKIDAKKEIDFARDIQLSLLPSSSTRTDHLEFESFATTANEVGGDYVDVISTSKGVYLIIADVSGKGLGAALYMFRLQALVHLLIKKAHPGPKELFLELNDYIKSGKKDKTFVTACIAYFPSGEDYFRLCRAGHNPPLLYSGKKDSSTELRSTGFALGMTNSNKLASHLNEVIIPFAAGDSILFYTDGLTEARNHLNQEYGLDRLRSLFEIYGSLHAKSIVNKIQNSLENFVGNTRLADDITFNCVRKKVIRHNQLGEATINEPVRDEGVKG
ncbi:MAG: PP2C family protein-serine/threonine phosphatase [Balneolales bacterium]